MGAFLQRVRERDRACLLVFTVQAAADVADMRDNQEESTKGGNDAGEWDFPVYCAIFLHSHCRAATICTMGFGRNFFGSYCRADREILTQLFFDCWRESSENNENDTNSGSDRCPAIVLLTFVEFDCEQSERDDHERHDPVGGRMRPNFTKARKR